VIREDRTVTREKYSEAKLQSQFFKVSPGYMLASPASNTSIYSNSARVAITPLFSNNTGSFFVVRHLDYVNTGFAEYTLNLPTSAGTLTIPQLGGTLLLNGRDSKVHVVDYPVGNVTLLYSTAEIFTWKKFEDKTVLVVYGGRIENHEIAIKTPSTPNVVEGRGIMSRVSNGSVVLQWKVTADRMVIEIDDLYIYMIGWFLLNSLFRHFLLPF
jgi:hypothetical protein